MLYYCMRVVFGLSLTFQISLVSGRSRRPVLRPHDEASRRRFSVDCHGTPESLISYMCIEAHMISMPHCIRNTLHISHNLTRDQPSQLKSLCTRIHGLIPIPQHTPPARHTSFPTLATGPESGPPHPSTTSHSSSAPSLSPSSPHTQSASCSAYSPSPY